MRSDETCRKLLEAIADLPLGETQIMEVCGTHTMAIAEAGIRSLLPKHIRLISGPGCPVCVTPPEDIDAVLDLAMEPDVVLTSYGDMLRVPGSRRGDSLMRRRALGADVRIVYSPVDAVEIAAQEPGELKNFTVLSLLKSVEPALRALMATEDFAVSGFLCPGHVATIIGEAGFRFLPEEYRMPGVISGFETEEILTAVYLLLKQIADGAPKIQNAYTKAVRPEGNILARQMLERAFTLQRANWRGLGEIPQSGFALREELSDYDAAKRFRIHPGKAVLQNGCRCGEVITGKLRPRQCPLFERVCTPEDPVGPCMVSSEGACAAAYKYQEI